MVRERFANNAQTTLASAVTSPSQNFIIIVSSTDFPSQAQFRIKINYELMLVTNVTSIVWTVQRGIEGTLPALHALGDDVVHILTVESFEIGSEQFYRENEAAYGLDLGPPNLFTVSLDPPLDVYQAGTMISFKANHTNTGISSLNVNGLGAKEIRKNGTINLNGGEINAAQVVTVIYDGDGWQLISSPDELSRVRADDGYAGYLEDKIEAGEGIYISVNETDLDNLKLTISTTELSPGDVGDRIFSAFGRESGLYGLGGTLTYLDRYLKTTDVWSHRTGNTAREKSVGFGIEEKGFVAYGDILNLDSYDDLTDSWSVKTSPPSPIRTDATALVLSTHFGSVMGGYGNSMVLPDHVQYNYFGDSWDTRTFLPVEKSGHVAFKFNVSSEGYVVGGTNNSVRVVSIFRYDNIGDAWDLVAAHPDHGNNARTDGVAFSDGSNLAVYYGGDNGTPLSDVNRFIQTGNSWTNDILGPIQVRAGGAVSGSSGYFFGGNSGDSTDIRTNLQAGYAFNYSARADLPQPGRRDMATFLI